MRFLLRDRDGKYSPAIYAIFHAEEIDILPTAPQTPRMNSHCERVIQTLRHELYDHVPVLNEAHAHRLLATFKRHYSMHRPHQARGQLPPETDQPPAIIHHRQAHRAHRTSILGGLVNEYRYIA
jgi:hypothetical protein